MTEKDQHLGVSRTMVPVTAELLQLIRDRMDALSITGVRDLAHRAGGALGTGSVHRILTHQNTRVRAQTIAALADALQVNSADLLAAAGVRNAPWVMPADFDSVDPAVRPDVERALRRLLQVGGLMPHRTDPDA